MSRPPPRDDDELALAAAVRAGDERAFTRLVNLHHAGMVRVAKGILKDATAAEDVAQSTWLALLDHKEAFEGRSSLRTWLFRVTTNHALTRATRNRTVPFSTLEDETEGSTAGRFLDNGHWARPVHAWQARDPGQQLQDAETREVLEKALESLPPMQRSVVLLRDVEGLDTAEVCNALGLTESNARVLLHRGRGRLRDALAKVYGDPEGSTP